MTKKDFILIAKIIKSELHGIKSLKETCSLSAVDAAFLDGCLAELHDLVEIFVKELKLNNKLFNKDRFMEACGYENKTNN